MRKKLSEFRGNNDSLIVFSIININTNLQNIILKTNNRNTHNLLKKETHIQSNLVP